MGAFFRRPFVNPWLAWFEDVQAISGCTSFARDPDLKQMRAWFREGMTAAEAAMRARRAEGQPRGR